MKFVRALMILFCFQLAFIEMGLSQTLRVACIQMEVTHDLDVNLQRILKGIDEASTAHVRLALFPETALSGFTRETIAALNWNQLNDAMKQIAAKAKEKSIYVLYGSATPSGKEKPYNSAILIGPDGNEVTRYHKMFPESWFELGQNLSLFEVDDIPCTMMICHDERFPELVRIPVLNGAQICFYISYEINGLAGALRKMEGYRAQLIARAVENTIWVVQSNGIGPLGGAEAVSLGQSHIVAPDGSVVMEAPALQDTMLTYDVHPELAKRSNALETWHNPFLKSWWMSAHSLLYTRPIAAAPMQKTKIRVAMMQSVPEKWNLDKNFQTFLYLLPQASEKQAELFITPECWLDGYASPDKTSTPQKLRTIAQEVDSSPYLKRVAQEAKQRSMYICFGFTSLEKDKIYDAAGLWNDQGELVGVYHKTHLQSHDLQYSPGDSLPVWSSPWGPLGIMICADRRWPETARVLRLQGARLILNPSYGMHGTNNETWMKTRGYENQCFIAFAHPSVGFVVNPKGEITDKREDEHPGLLISDVNLEEAKDNNHLADRRPELYEILTAPK